MPSSSSSSSSTKHILNTPKTLVSDALHGLTSRNPALKLDEEHSTVILKEIRHDRVQLVCGGGAGHEPAHAGFVGKGMLSCAVSGQVFASPNSRQVEAALDGLSISQQGTLIIVKNYTGDVLQFGLAKERWSATHPEEPDRVRMLVVGDDVAVPKSQGLLTGRRGLASTVLIYKIAGALADTGASLDEVEFLAQSVSERCGTIGMGMDHCHVPGTEGGKESYLKDDEAEIGMGIHNEPGIQKLSLPTAEKVIDQMMTTLTSTADEERSYLPFKNDGSDSVILQVNNLGGLPSIEMDVIVKEALSWLQQKRISVERVLSGTYMTSLNLPGFSLSLLLLPTEALAPDGFETKTVFDKDLIIECLDAPTEAPAWPWHYKGRPQSSDLKSDEKAKDGKSAKAPKRADQVEDGKGPQPTNSKLFIDAIERALANVIKAEPELTKYDTIAGDGDAGLTLKSGAEGIQAQLDEGGISSTDVVSAMVSISAVVEKDMGGTSGGLYSIFFAALSKGLLEAQKDRLGKEKDETRTIADAKLWARALELALNSLYRYTRARPPSRTLVDPLAAFVITLGSDPDSNVLAAFTAAKEAAEATRSLDAKAGRAAYVDRKGLQEADVPDPGAWGVWMLLSGIQAAMTEEK